MLDHTEEPNGKHAGAFATMPRMSRNRLLWVGLIAVVILFGLSTRLPAFPASRGMTGYIGDAAWALAVFFGYGLLVRSLPTIQTVVLAAATSLLVELLQLYHAVWIDSVRATTLGRLVLGSDFDPVDLICYGAGIGIGAFIERKIFRFAQKRQQQDSANEHRG